MKLTCEKWKCHMFGKMQLPFLPMVWQVYRCKGAGEFLVQRMLKEQRGKRAAGVLKLKLPSWYFPALLMQNLNSQMCHSYLYLVNNTAKYTETQKNKKNRGNGKQKYKKRYRNNNYYLFTSIQKHKTVKHSSLHCHTILTIN